jgi:crotonobetainyl-CoA:carnitine CoA-transferase CaiB-like acyl-CoA transferase
VKLASRAYRSLTTQFAPDHWRSGPLLGEDNDYVLGSVLGYSTDDIAALAAEGVI